MKFLKTDCKVHNNFIHTLFPASLSFQYLQSDQMGPSKPHSRITFFRNLQEPYSPQWSSLKLFLWELVTYYFLSNFYCQHSKCYFHVLCWVNIFYLPKTRTSFIIYVLYVTSSKRTSFYNELVYPLFAEYILAMHAK